MPVIYKIDDVEIPTTAVASTATHDILRVTDDYFLAVGDTVPDGEWLTDVLPVGDWFTEWSANDCRPLIVHITRGE